MGFHRPISQTVLFVVHFGFCLIPLVFSFQASAQLPSIDQAEQNLYKKYGITPPSDPSRSGRRRTPSERAAEKRRKEAEAKPKGPNKAEKSESMSPEEVNASARSELTVPKYDQSAAIQVSPATVTLKASQVANPNTFPKFQLGMSFQSYQPVGQSQVSGTDAFDLNQLGSVPMAALLIRYLPFSYGSQEQWSYGFYGSIGYAQNKLFLKTPIGLAIDDANLHTSEVEVGYAQRYRFVSQPKLSALGLLGLGRLDSIQTSDTALANASSYLYYGSLGAMAEFQIMPKWALTAGYEYRLMLDRSSSDAGIQNNNVMLGFLGSFQ